MALKLSGIKCAHCRKHFLAYCPPSRLRKYCSQKCGSMSNLGHKQSADWVVARKRFGSDHHRFVGDLISIKGGRSRALRKFPSPKECEICGRGRCRIDRHHIDGDTSNNDQKNIKFLCRKCHMTIDGRIARMREVRRGCQMS